jgi:hypothetical protein
MKLKGFIDRHSNVITSCHPLIHPSPFILLSSHNDNMRDLKSRALSSAKNHALELSSVAIVNY